MENDTSPRSIRANSKSNIIKRKNNRPSYSPLVFNYSKPMVIESQELPVRLRSLAMCRGEFSAVIA